tara:strand:- start:640 stop:1611 length:972 start_codon:yes stop_codon:yes gene_type:complete
MNLIKYISIFSLLILYSCTKEIDIPIENKGKQFVVNGYIEHGEVPKILLQRSLPYFDPIVLDDDIANSSIFKSLINDATVTITNSNGESEVLSLTNSINLGYPGFTDTWFYNYEGTGYIIGQENMSYRLEIEKDDTLVWAITTIPKLARINEDSLRFLYRADDSSYCYLLGNLVDPDTIGNCYRAFSKTKSKNWGEDPFYMPMLEQDGNYNDEYINGWDFSFPMYKGRGFWQEWGEQENEGSGEDEVDGSSGATTGFWNIGDEVSIKWSSVDRGSWDFWISLQYNNPGGPFGSPAQAKTNINGGLGVFGGGSSQYIERIAQPE